MGWGFLLEARITFSKSSSLVSMLDFQGVTSIVYDLTVALYNAGYTWYPVYPVI